MSKDKEGYFGLLQLCNPSSDSIFKYRGFKRSATVSLSIVYKILYQKDKILRKDETKSLRKIFSSLRADELQRMNLGKHVKAWVSKYESKGPLEFSQDGMTFGIRMDPIGEGNGWDEDRT